MNDVVSLNPNALADYQYDASPLSTYGSMRRFD